jgi:hypothetical protein
MAAANLAIIRAAQGRAGRRRANADAILSMDIGENPNARRSACAIKSVDDDEKAKARSAPAGQMSPTNRGSR